MRVRVHRFEGEICGVGTTSGCRIVVGHWVSSPFGAFADAMVERADGHRLLIAPSEEVADYVATVYAFDAVVVAPVAVERSDGHLAFAAGPLELEATLGGRTGLGRLLRVVPGSVARSRPWAALVDPIARLALKGVRTRGSTAGGEEFYGATDSHRVVAVRARLDGTDLGGLADVAPPVRFGFGSTPRRPSVVAVTTIVRPRPRPIAPD